MKIDTVLFDLDGTLLPMKQQEFMQVYFSLLGKKCAAFGYAPEEIQAAVWNGTKAMVQNDGTQSNEQRFWQSFAQQMGEEVLKLKPELEQFYSREFHGAKVATRENPVAVKLLRELKAKGFTLVLATNPLFPLRAIHARLSWIGVPLEVFDLVTTYEDSHFCKPNTEYYTEILQKIHKYPDKCLMVGNDVKEDGCVRKLGMEFYLVNDEVLNADGEDMAGMQSGSFDDMCYWLRGKVGIV